MIRPWIFTDHDQYPRPWTLLTASKVYFSTLQITSPPHRWYCRGTLQSVPKYLGYISLKLAQIFCLPRGDPFYVSCPPLHQQPRQCGHWKPEGWEKLRHRWAVHNIVYIPDYWHSSPIQCYLSYHRWRHCSVPEKIIKIVVIETTLLPTGWLTRKRSVSEIWFHFKQEIRHEILWQNWTGGCRRLWRLTGGCGGWLEADWRLWRLTGGYLEAQ